MSEWYQVSVLVQSAEPPPADPIDFLAWFTTPGNYLDGLVVKPAED